MELTDLSSFLNDNGLAVLILLGLAFLVYKVVINVGIPYFQRKLNSGNNLTEEMTKQFFQQIKDSKAQMKSNEETNKKILKQLEEVNKTNSELAKTNRELSETNKELSIATKELVSGYGERIVSLEENTEKINKKIDTLLNK